MATAALHSDPLDDFGVLVAEVQRRGLSLPESFGGFVDRHNPTLASFEHIPRLVSVADRVAHGELRRVLVILPPRYLKSETFSRLLPAYYLRQHPDRHVGLASYGSELAWSLSEEARNYYQADHGQVADATAAKKRWRTTGGGEMWAAGVGGPLLGFGFHLGIVDDPTDPEKAVSPTYQRRFREWWPAKFLSRQEPDAAIVVVMQRLGMGDPIEFLLRRELGDGAGIEKAPEHWHVVLADEIRSDEPLGHWDGPMGLPPTCTLEPDPRPLGALLAPSRFSAEQVESMRRAAGPYVTSAQRQGRPMRPAGDFWREKWFRVYDDLPADAYNGGKDWDTAYTKNEANSASAWVESYRGKGKDDEYPVYIHDVGWDWREFPQLVEWMKSLSGPHYVESRATGKSAVQSLNSHGVAADEVDVKGDKFARAAAVQPVVSNGRIYVRRQVLETLLSGEEQGLLRVTAEQLQRDEGGLDLNDAFVQALHRHANLYSTTLSFGSF